MSTGNTSPGAGGPAEPGWSQGGEDGLAQKADTSAPSFYSGRISDVSQDQEILANDLNFT